MATEATTDRVITDAIRSVEPVIPGAAGLLVFPPRRLDPVPAPPSRTGTSTSTRPLDRAEIGAPS